MRKSEICRAISGRLEPTAVTTVINEPFRRRPEWKWHHVGGGNSRRPPYTYTPIPLDYFTSEDACARLLDAMLAECGSVQFMRMKNGAFVIDSAPGDQEEYFWFAGECPSRQAAIVLAACRWLNIDYGTLGD